MANLKLPNSLSVKIILLQYYKRRLQFQKRKEKEKKAPQ